MSSPEDSPHPIPPADTFIRAARFPDQDTAGVVYFAAQTWLATAEPALNVSVFRLQYAEWWAVGALGLLPPGPGVPSAGDHTSSYMVYLSKQL